VHAPPAGQHPSLFVHELIEENIHAPPEHRSFVQGLLSLHCAAEMQEMQLVIGEETHLLLEQEFAMQALLPSH
jgi:hypothetical protein